MPRCVYGEVDIVERSDTRDRGGGKSRTQSGGSARYGMKDCS